jgi:DNA-binding MarR family transcriptional regulator
MQQQALSTIVSWVRLERALEAFHLELRQRFGITGLQLAVLRILAERPRLPLAALRKALVAHPATLGQAIDGLRRRELVTVRTDAADRRARNVALTRPAPPCWRRHRWPGRCGCARCRSTRRASTG